MASEQLLELEKFKYEMDQKLKDHHNVQQQKTDLERHVQALIKVSSYSQISIDRLTLAKSRHSHNYAGLSPPFEGC